MKFHASVLKYGRASLAPMMTLSLAILLTVACGSSADSVEALPDSAKSEEMIAEELYECLGDIDLGMGSVAEGLRQAGFSKDEVIRMIVDLSTKQELIKERDACLSLGQ